MQHLDNVDDADMNEADNEDHSESEQELDSESDHDSEDDEEKNEDSKNKEGEFEFEEENGEADDRNAKQQRFISIIFYNLYSQFVRTFRLLLLCRFVVKSFYLSFFLKLKPKKKLSSLFEWW